MKTKLSFNLFVILSLLLAALPVQATRATPAASTAPSDLLQFSSSGHALGFGAGGMYVATGSHALTNYPSLTWNTFLGGSGNDYGISIALDGSGNVYVTGASTTTWGNPVRAYVGGYEAFVAKLNSSGTLIWNTFLGGSGEDDGYGIAVDGSGNIYVTGMGDGTWGSPVQAYGGGSYDTFAAKLNSSTGALVWNSFLGGSGDDYSNGIALDGSGNVYVTGSSNATWGSPVQAYGGGSNDAFAAKLNSSTGALTWNTFLGGSGYDEGYGITVGGIGNVYVTGDSNATWGSPEGAYSGGYDAFAANLNSSTGVLTWNTFLGGSGGDYGSGIAIDGSGNLYVTGDTNATWGSPVGAYSGSWDAFAVKLNSSTGALTWNSFLGGSGIDQGLGIAVDGSGNIYVTGHSTANWGNPMSPFSGGNRDAFAAKLNSSTGALTWNTFLGGSGTDYGNGIAVDGGGNVYVTGDSTATWGSPVGAYTGGYDAFAVKVKLFDRIFLPLVIR